MGAGCISGKGGGKGGELLTNGLLGLLHGAVVKEFLLSDPSWTD